MTEGDLVKLLYDNCAFPALVTTESGRDLVARERATAFSKPVKMRSASWATCVRYFVKCTASYRRATSGWCSYPTGRVPQFADCSLGPIGVLRHWIGVSNRHAPHSVLPALCVPPGWLPPCCPSNCPPRSSNFP